METFKLSPEEISRLKALHRTVKNKKAAYRLHAIILLGSGWTVEKVAECLFISRDSVDNWLSIFKEGGEESLLHFFYKGGISKMSAEQEKELCDFLDSHLISTAKEVVAFVKKRFNLDYTPEGMVIVLHRLGFSYKKTKLRPSKADEEKQKAFVQEYAALKANLKENEKIYFMDGVHPTHNVMPAHAWIRTGEEREIKSNTGRQRININGVYSPQDQEIITIESPTINSQSTIELLQKIEAAHPELEKVYVVRDNAKYYCSKLVKEYLAQSKIVMIPLPSYSPNLNLIERLWKFFKKKVLANRYYDTFEAFRGAVRDFFEHIGLYTEELVTLMTEKFHIFQSKVMT